MKLTYQPTPQHTFIIEGTIDEIFNVIDRITPPTQQRQQRQQPVVQVIDPKPSKSTKTNPLVDTDDFLKSIYLYEPNPANDSGRGAYIAQQILKGATLNIDKLVSRSQGRRDTVFNVVRRMNEAGAVVELTKTTVKLVSLPEPPYKAKRYAMSTHDNRTTPVVATRSTSARSSIPKELNNILSAIRVD